MEQTGGNKKEKIGEEDENERNAYGGVVCEDIEVVMCSSRKCP